MSTQSKAKELQGYTTAQHGCCTCAHFMSDLVLPAWMRETNANEEPRQARYTVESHGVEKNLRCGPGGFPVKKTASCDRYEVKT